MTTDQRRYRALADRFREEHGSLSLAELEELRRLACGARNHLLEQLVEREVGRRSAVVLTDEEARVVGAALEVVREDVHRYGLVAPIAVRAGRSGIDTMIVVDRVVDAIQRRHQAVTG